MARMFNPPHPGLTLRDDVLPALGLTVTQAAQQLDVSRVALSRVLNGRAAISPEMALRIEAWLGATRGGEARLWLAEQSAYDVWQAAQRFMSRLLQCMYNLRRWPLDSFRPQLVRPRSPDEKPVPRWPAGAPDTGGCIGKMLWQRNHRQMPTK